MLITVVFVARNGPFSLLPKGFCETQTFSAWYRAQWIKFLSEGEGAFLFLPYSREF